jgi:hypothetical protein
MKIISVPKGQPIPEGAIKLNRKQRRAWEKEMRKQQKKESKNVN